MVFFIRIAIGAAVAGVAAAGAVGVAVKKRRDKKKRQRENSVQTPVDQERHPGGQPHSRPAQRAQRQRSQTAERGQRPQPQRERQENRSGQPLRDKTIQRQPKRPQGPQASETQPGTRPRKLPPYDKQALVKALDMAIAKAASDTLEAAFAQPPLSSLSPEVRFQRVVGAADEMRSALGSLKTANYNDNITAAAYALNYHPSHIGLAHATVDQFVRSRGGPLISDDSGHLHIVDLASGTLAMQFGIAIAVADALIRGERIKAVVVDSIDISPEMLKVGRMAWDNFILNVQNDEKLAALAGSCQIIEPHRYIRYDAVPARDGECWISCLHGIYQRGSGDLERALHALCDKHRPAVGLMTCWGISPDDQNVNIAMRISPFQGDNWRHQRYFLPKGHEYDIPFLFNNREPSASVTKDVGRRSGVLPPSWDIFWRPTDTAVLTYQRRVSDHGH